MSVRERILTIRLMQKANANPAYAGKLGITVRTDPRTKGTRYASNQIP